MEQKNQHTLKEYIDLMAKKNLSVDKLIFEKALKLKNQLEI